MFTINQLLEGANTSQFGSLYWFDGLAVNLLEHTDGLQVLVIMNGKNRRKLVKITGKGTLKSVRKQIQNAIDELSSTFLR